MALYIGEDEVWKCPKHPSKRRRNGICPTCLRDRLGTLCPNCATLRPCSCPTTATSSSTSSYSSSSSSSFSLFSSFSSSRRVTAPVDTQPKLRRSSSVAVPSKTTSFWGSFRKNKTRKGENEEAKDVLEKDNLDEESCYYSSKIEDFERMMMKSRSMRAPITSEIGGGDVKGSSKGKFWGFPSPIKVFRQRSKVVQDRSPLQRF